MIQPLMVVEQPMGKMYDFNINHLADQEIASLEEKNYWLTTNRIARNETEAD